MKVLALVVLVLAISGMEAGVVKREVPQVFQPLADFFQTLGDNMKTNVQDFYEKFNSQDLIQKFNVDDLQSQAQDLAKKAQEQAEPWKAEVEKFFEKLTKQFQ